MPGQLRRGIPWTVVVVHAAIVGLSVVALVVVSTVYYTPDANIGAGLVLMWIAALGLPWSLPILTGSVQIPETIPAWLQAGVFVLCAVMNVLVHAGIVFAVHRMRRPSQR
jgi:hypothetical protein